VANVGGTLSYAARLSSLARRGRPSCFLHLVITTWACSRMPTVEFSNVAFGRVCGRFRGRHARGRCAPETIPLSTSLQVAPFPAVALLAHRAAALALPVADFYMPAAALHFSASPSLLALLCGLNSSVRRLTDRRRAGTANTCRYLSCPICILLPHVARWRFGVLRGCPPALRLLLLFFRATTLWLSPGYISPAFAPGAGMTSSPYFCCANALPCSRSVRGRRDGGGGGAAAA